MGKKGKKWKPLSYTNDLDSAQKNNVVEEDDVKDMLKGAYEVIEKTVVKLYNSSNLVDHPFFFIHANAYVLVGTKMFYPCEIAVLRFSLRKGIEETYHTLINPGSLPVGFAHDANSYSEVTHRIPYPPLKEAVPEFAKIISEVQQFVWGGPKAVEEQRRRSEFMEEDMCLPPMYTFYDKELFHYDFVNEAVVYDMMQKLTTFSDSPCRFVIHPMAKLMYELQNTGALQSGNDSKWTSVQDAQEILEKDSFLYTPMLGCQFHEKIDAPVCCSLSLVKRWALTFSRHRSASFKVQRPLVSDESKEKTPSVATSSNRAKQHEQSDSSWQAAPTTKHRLPTHTMPKLRQPYANIGDLKPPGN